VYLIDLADAPRHVESLVYLAEMLEVLDEVGYDRGHPIYICFSKYDPEAHVTAATRTQLTEWMARLQNKISARHPKYQFHFWTTSIYNIYSIVAMVSSGLVRYIKNYEKLRYIVGEFGVTNRVNLALVFDHTGLVIADYLGFTELEDALKGKLDQIIGNSLQFFKQFEEALGGEEGDDEEEDLEDIFEVDNHRAVIGDLMTLCYRFRLASKAELPPAVRDSPMLAAPLLANYYCLALAPLDQGIDTEHAMQDLLQRVSHEVKVIVQEGLVPRA
jgi:hypothetical protein